MCKKYRDHRKFTKRIKRRDRIFSLGIIPMHARHWCRRTHTHHSLLRYPMALLTVSKLNLSIRFPFEKKSRASSFERSNARNFFVQKNRDWILIKSFHYSWFTMSLAKSTGSLKQLNEIALFGAEIFKLFFCSLSKKKRVEPSSGQKNVQWVIFLIEKKSL